ncbi:Calcium-independent phospholipase A2-gamma [Colletotrichum fructicola Nara gc5]|uniref:Calcium-independent phospholipase A2-gamma n=1 Tax=Colletotrichum fructicola (strain Nara gc5) TaxID=1213859 RepID=A0A7J6JA20_COLFN|nr:Calcium-independent phospholipase A2-gamma [Colletotrichum fructicola Nara gc5]
MSSQNGTSPQRSFSPGPTFRHLTNTAGASSPTTVTKVDEGGNTTYAELILVALRSSKTKQMGLRDLYKWFEENTDRGTRKGLKNSVRSNLCMNKAFERVEGKGSYWKLADAGLTEIQPTHTYRATRNKTARASAMVENSVASSPSSPAFSARDALQEDASDTGHGDGSPWTPENRTSPERSQPEGGPSADYPTPMSIVSTQDGLEYMHDPLWAWNLDSRRYINWPYCTCFCGPHQLGWVGAVDMVSSCGHHSVSPMVMNASGVPPGELDSLHMMTGCKHTGWLRGAAKDHAYTVECSDRAQRLLDSLPCPDGQYPSALVLIGNATKRVAMQRLGVTITRPNTTRGHGEIHLSLAPVGASGARPTLVADADVPPHRRLGRPKQSTLCHELVARPLAISHRQDRPPTAVEVGDHVYNRMLLPFADAVCFFADDVGGVEAVARRLGSWLDLGAPSTSSVRPWLVVVTNGGDENRTRSQLLQAVRKRTHAHVSERFHGVRIISLADATPTSTRRQLHSLRWDILSNELSYMAETKRVERVLGSCLFSATHLAGLLRHAAEHIGDAGAPPLDFLAVSRLDSPVAPDLPAHLARFLTHCDSVDDLKRFAVPVIASSFVLDQYPPGMHLFDPRDVFQMFYKDVCHNVCGTAVLAHEGSTDFVLPSQFSKMIEAQMARIFRQLTTGQTSASLHRQLVAAFAEDWARLRSDSTCFHCLRRRPQFFPECGHGQCENCVKVFGIASAADPWLVEVDECILCGQTICMQVRVKPDTASARVLCIDGGGTRGKYPLKLLKQLEDDIGLPGHPVQQNFDVVFGTSSGAISAGALCINGWTVDECIARFESFSNHAFTPRGVPSIPIISSLVRLMMQVPVLATVVRAAAVLLFDSRYPSQHIEQALRDMFGSDRGIADYSAADKMGAMVGMTVATVRDASACIFTNYNGSGQRGGDRDYELLRTSVNGGQLALWEILRCATAAPYYFTPWSIEGLGTFQDGGLVANNPSAIALQEVASVFPEDPDPSLLVSVGTGSSARVSDGGWRDCFPLRLARAFLNRDKNAWQRVVAQKKVGRSGEFFRFDVEFDGPEPPLDSLSSFDDPERDDGCTFEGLPPLRRLVLCVRAELFFFELRDSQPYLFSDGGYECCAHIRCRLAAGSGSLKEFMRQLAGSKAYFRIGDHQVVPDFTSCPTAFPDGHFRLEVKFRVASLQDSVAVCLWETPDEGRHISGSPFTVRQLLQSQKLEQCFGTSDHRKKRSRDEDNDDISRKRRRRR